MATDRTRVLNLLQENDIDFKVHESGELNGYVRAFRVPGSQKKIEGGDWITFEFNADGSLKRISTIGYWEGMDE